MNTRTRTLMAQATLEEQAAALHFLVMTERITESQLVAALVISKQTLNRINNSHDEHTRTIY